MLSDYLVEFSVVVQQGTISRAAEQLNMSQSTLTRHLTILESTLNAKLMERNAVGVRLTEEGQFVYDTALQMVSLGNELVQSLQYWGNREGGQFSHLVVGGLSGLRIIAEAFGTACEHLSLRGFDISLQYLPPSTPLSVETVLERHEMDIVLTFAALARRLEGKSGLQQEEMFSIPAVVIMDCSHPLAGATSLSARNLEDVTFARVASMKDNAGAAWDEFVRQCATKGFSPMHQTFSHQNMSINNQSQPGNPIIQVSDSLNARLAREQGSAVVPISDLFFQVVAIIRDDDKVAFRLLEESKSFL